MFIEAVKFVESFYLFHCKYVKLLKFLAMVLQLGHHNLAFFKGTNKGDKFTFMITIYPVLHFSIKLKFVLTLMHNPFLCNYFLCIFLLFRLWRIHSMVYVQKNLPYFAHRLFCKFLTLIQDIKLIKCVVQGM